MVFPSISVVMAVYNNDRYLKMAVNSILSQTFTDFEFLITDDGSTDQSLKILQSYTVKDSRIRLNSHDNRGISKTRNEMLQQAKGEFIAVMDADDIALPERFERQVRFLQQHPDVVCVGSSLDWIDENGCLIGHCPMPESDGELQRFMVGGISLLHHPTAMVRRSPMIAVGGYDETLQTSIDLDLWLKLGEIGALANLPESLLLYRLHNRSVTNAKQAQQSQDALTACQNAWKRRGIQGEFIRQPADHMKQYDFWLQRGWEGFWAGKRDVARRCGRRAIAIRPIGRNAWKLLAYSVFKPLPKPESP